MATIELHSCVGGVVEVPDLRGGRDCYGDDYDSMVITQIPSPGEQVGAGQTIINVLTEDGNGNATLCTHYLNVTADNPAPTLVCPDPISTWLLTGGYSVPDLTTEVEILGGCTVYDDLVITQSPAAGTLLTNAGTHTITITVTDEFGHEVVCGTTTIELRSPSVVNPVVIPPEVPVENPSHFYTPNLLAYWPFDDIALYRDATVLLGYTPRDLTNAGSSINVDETALGSCFGSGAGPLFGVGSMYMNRSNSHYATRADDSGLRLTGVSWTMRFGLKVVAADAGTAKKLINKHVLGASNGYNVEILGFGGAIYGLYVSLFSSNTIPILDITQFGFSTNTWYVVTITMDDTNGVLKLYRDGAVIGTDTALGQHITGSAQQLMVGDDTNGTGMEAYIDQLGIWTEAWGADRVMDDYRVVRCIT